MPSPQIEVLFFYDLSTGAPLTGLTPVFEFYKDDLGANLTPPTITEIGGGAYKFTPAFPADPLRAVIYVVDAGATANPRRQARFVRPEDWNTDVFDMGDVQDAVLGKWEIKTTGPDANHLIFYRLDGVTVLKKFLLTDAAGVPTTINPFKRTPV